MIIHKKCHNSGYLKHFKGDSYKNYKNPAPKKRVLVLTLPEYSSDHLKLQGSVYFHRSKIQLQNSRESQNLWPTNLTEHLVLSSSGSIYFCECHPRG